MPLQRRFVYWFEDVSRCIYLIFPDDNSRTIWRNILKVHVEVSHGQHITRIDFQVCDSLQRLGVTLSHQGMLDTMSAISGSFNSQLIDTVKNGKKFRIVSDNINFHLGVARCRKGTGKVAHMEHWFGSAAIVQNLSFTTLDDSGLQHDLRHLRTTRFILDQQEWNDTHYNFSVQACRVLVEFFPWLKSANAAVNKPIHDIPEGLKIKNQVIPLPIVHKNEQKYTEVIHILASYQEICNETYEATGKALEKVHIGGDQLTRERFSGAKRLRALLSEKNAYECTYGVFVNTGNSIIPADLQMEHLVRVTKGHLRSMCSNVTDKSLIKRSSAFFGMNEIAQKFGEESKTVKRAQKHKRLSSFDDEMRIIKDLRAVRPFTLSLDNRHKH